MNSSGWGVHIDRDTCSSAARLWARRAPRGIRSVMRAAEASLDRLHERVPVVGRRGAEDAVEVQAQVGAGAEAHAVGDLLDAEVAALEQFTREVARARGSTASACSRGLGNLWAVGSDEALEPKGTGPEQRLTGKFFGSRQPGGRARIGTCKQSGAYAGPLADVR